MKVCPNCNNEHDPNELYFMLKAKELVAVRLKPKFENVRGMNFAYQIEGVTDADRDYKEVAEFTKTAKKGYVGAKGKATMPAVKKWVRENKPSQFYAKWKADSSMWKDDTVEIWYVK